MLFIPVGGIAKSRESVRVDAECLRLELSDPSTNNRSVEYNTFTNSLRDSEIKALSLDHYDVDYESFYLLASPC